MNAVPPKGQMPQPDLANPPGEPIHLTMSFEDDTGEDMGAAAALVPPEAELAKKPETAARRTRAGVARANPTEAEAEEPTRPDTAAQPQQRQPDHPAGMASPAASAPPRGALPPQFAQIELSLTVEVGSLNISLKELVLVEPGQLLALDRMTNEPVSVLVNGKPFARGEIVAVGDRYGVRLLEIVSSSAGDS